MKLVRPAKSTVLEKNRPEIPGSSALERHTLHLGLPRSYSQTTCGFLEPQTLVLVSIYHTGHMKG